jgi:hypothetical protein
MVAVAAAYLGAEADARALLKPFEAVGGALSGGWGPLSFPELGTITDDPVDPAPSMSRTELVSRFDDDVVATLLAEPIDPLLAVQVRHLGGALAEDRPGPHGPITEDHAISMIGLARTPEAGAAVAAKQAELTAALGDAVTGRKPVTFLGLTDTLANAFSAQELERLRATKEKWDPQGRLMSNFPVRK